MGRDKFHNRNKHIELNHYGYPVLSVDRNYFMDLLKRVNRMAEIKILVWLSNLLGIPILGYTIWITWYSWKTDVLFVLSGVYLIAKIYFYIKKNNQSIRMTDLDIREKEKDLYD